MSRRKHMMSGEKGPEEKRRKTEPADNDDCWEEEDDFSQAELETLDILLTQKVPEIVAVEQNNNAKLRKTPTPIPIPPPANNVNSRMVGGSNRKSLSAGEMHSTTSSFSVQQSQQQTQRRFLKKTQVQFSSNNGHSRALSTTPSSQNFPSGPVWSSNVKAKTQPELEALQKEVKRLQSVTWSAEGKVKNLELNVKQKDKEIHRLRQEKLLHNQEEAQKKAEKEKQLQRDNEKMKTELEFKQQEILELQRNLKHEQLQRSGGGDMVMSPNHRSPKLLSPQSRKKIALRSPVTPKGNFPTKLTFMGDDRSPSKSIKQEAPVCSTTHKKRRMKLAPQLADVSRQTTGPQLVSKLMSGGVGTSSGSGEAASNEGLLRLLHTSALPLPQEEHSTRKGKRKPQLVSKLSAVDPSSTAASANSVTQEHHSLAMQAVSALLHSPSLENSDSVILLLPLLESHISRYVDSLRIPPSTVVLASTSMKDNAIAGTSGAANVVNINSQGGFAAAAAAAAAAGDTSSSTSSRDSDLSSSMHSLSLDSAEKCALDALSRLNVLVRHSAEVRQALVTMAGTGSGSGTNVNEPSTSSPQKELRVLGEGGGSGSRSGTPVPASCRSRILHHSNLFSLLTMLADPQPSRQGLSRTWPLSVSTSSLHVLTTLAQLTENLTQLQIFEPMFASVLCNCLEDVSLERLPLFSATLELFTALVKSEKLFKLMCTNSGGCLLLNTYHCIMEIPFSYQVVLRRSIKYKLLLLLSSIVQEYGADTLLSDCHCGQEVVKCLVLCLYNELSFHTNISSSSSSASTAMVPYKSRSSTKEEAHNNQNNHKSSSKKPLSHSRSLLSVLQPGVQLLHALSLGGDRTFRRKRADVEHCYVQLMFAFEELVDAANMDGNNPIGSLINDLWDFEHPLPWEIWLDEEQDMEAE